MAVAAKVPRVRCPSGSTDALCVVTRKNFFEGDLMGFQLSQNRRYPSHPVTRCDLTWEPGAHTSWNGCDMRCRKDNRVG